MFIGHFALGFSAAKSKDSISLGTTFFAAQFLDLLWPFFLIMGWEVVEIDPGNTAYTPLNFVSYPISHSLLMAIAWGLIFGGVYYLITKRKNVSMVMGILVVSHWILDLITHRPDLPLTPWGETKAGFGLWNSIPGTIGVESVLFLLCVGIFITINKPRGIKSWLVLGGLLVFLVIINVGNVIGPPPPSVEMIGYVGFAQWLLVLWGYWIDRQQFATA